MRRGPGRMRVPLLLSCRAINCCSSSSVEPVTEEEGTKGRKVQEDSPTLFCDVKAGRQPDKQVDSISASPAFALALASFLICAALPFLFLFAFLSSSLRIYCLLKIYSIPRTSRVCVSVCSARPRTVYINPPLTSCRLVRPIRNSCFSYSPSTTTPTAPNPTHPALLSRSSLINHPLLPLTSFIHEDMFAQPAKQSTSTLPPTTHENPKQVTTIAVHVSTTVHTVIEPWPPGSPIESRSGESTFSRCSMEGIRPA